eukprot:689707-Hanusia_phi.AAC.2
MYFSAGFFPSPPPPPLSLSSLLLSSSPRLARLLSYQIRISDRDDCQTGGDVMFARLALAMSMFP